MYPANTRYSGGNAMSLLPPITNNHSILICLDNPILNDTFLTWSEILSRKLIEELLATVCFAVFNKLYTKVLKENRKIAVAYLSLDNDEENLLGEDITRLIEEAILVGSLNQNSNGIDFFTYEDKLIIRDDLIKLTNDLLKRVYYQVRDAISYIKHTEPIDNVNTISVSINYNVIVYRVSFTVKE